MFERGIRCVHFRTLALADPDGMACDSHAFRGNGFPVRRHGIPGWILLPAHPWPREREAALIISVSIKMILRG